MDGPLAPLILAGYLIMAYHATIFALVLAKLFYDWVWGRAFPGPGIDLPGFGL